MTESKEPEKRYFPIPKPLAEMTVEERREYANQLADFILQNEMLTPPRLSEELVEVGSGVIDSPSRFKKAVALVRKPFTFFSLSPFSILNLPLYKIHIMYNIYIYIFI